MTERVSCSGETLETQDELVQEPALDHQDEELDYYMPQPSQDTSYPTITVIREVPCGEATIENTRCTTLNPDARPFEPSGRKGGVHSPGEPWKRTAYLR